jgi:hypothetical protein
MRIGPSILERKFLLDLTALCKAHRKLLRANPTYGVLEICEIDPEFEGEYDKQDDGAVIWREPKTDTFYLAPEDEKYA